MIEQRETPEDGRFRPVRAGIINLWDYRDEEFVFADGWLVLRGPNGSGKTKALEVLFPFVLDGRIEPRRLNPFASEERTMKSNLLYRGQEVTHAYVWLELAAADRYVTVGIGLRAHRHVDRVTRWHFVVDGRVGVDFSLLDADDRPLNRRDMIAQLGPEAVRDSAEEHRRAVDARLFGLGPARYEQLLDLVLTLRKPQLAKDLNPTELSRTLQRGLRPLDEQLLVEAASSFEDMEAVARTLEGLVAADSATSAFLTVYATYLRTHARAAADALTTCRAAVDQHRTALTQAREALTGATAAEQHARAAVAAAEPEPGRLRARLDSVKSSDAYRSRQQLADLERHVHDLAAAARRAGATVAAEEDSVARRRGEAERATATAREARVTADRLATDLATDAATAGIAWEAGDVATEQLAAAVSARVSARRDDIRAVRRYAARLVDAEQLYSRAAEDAAAATAAVAEAEQQQEVVTAEVARSRQELGGALRQWADRHRALWQSLATPQLPAALSDAVGRLGEPGAPTMKELYAEQTASAVDAHREAVANLRAQQEARQRRRDALADEREHIASERDDAPSAPVTRTATRDQRPGAPLWRLVRFADHVPEAQAAGLEAALHAAGLLDAWLHPDAAGTAAALDAAEQDGYLVVGEAVPPPAAGTPTLADVLVPEDQDLVPSARVRAALAAIAVSDVATVAQRGGGTAAVSAGGQYAHGLTTGTLHKPVPEYIGATARAARRAARLAECDRRLDDLDHEIAEADRQRDAHQRVLAEVDRAAADLPPAAPVFTALRSLDHAAARLAARRDAETAAAARLDQAVAERSAAHTALRRVVTERALPAEQVDSVAEAVDRFERTGLRLDAAWRDAGRASEAAQQAEGRLDEAVERHTAAEQAAAEATARHREKDEAYQELYASVAPGGDRVLAEAAHLAEQIEAAEQAVRQAQERLASAREEQAVARTRVEMGEQAVGEAVRHARQEALRLRPFARPDLLGLLRCSTELRWPATEDQSESEELDGQVVALHEAILAATSQLSPTETSLKQSATRVTTALNELQAQLPAAGLDHRPEWNTDDGVIVVQVADEQGLSPVARFAERIARQRQDQEQLLTEAEQRILEDALLGQLARQIHTRTIEARDLVERMDKQMRSRRMSSGLTVGVGWQISDELDSEQREVCRLLERDPARLGPAQLSTLRRHFAGRIKAARALAPELPYRELLAQVLDYRQWRVFAFTLHRPGRTAEPLTRARHSQLSGGEQSVSLHLPLFAAANALFGSARSDAPRLLGLDEAFAGVDETGRGELMSLARQFDLDLFMTGYDLWATGPAVRAAAHFDLSHSAVDHAVSTVLVVWDGSASLADLDGALARALGSPQTRRAPGASVGGEQATRSQPPELAVPE